MEIIAIVIVVGYLLVASNIYFGILKKIKSGKRTLKRKNGEMVNGTDLYLLALQASLVWPYLPFRKKRKNK